MDHVIVARRVPPTRYAQSAGAKIAYQVSGEGSCDLVFVSGLVSHLDLQWQQLSYRRFVTALEHACRVIRFDKRGTGLSDPTDALPDMDERVVALAAQGHTNAEIADRLFLSRYTVETHLKHVFAKLGLRSRAELAAVAVSAPTTPPDT